MAHPPQPSKFAVSKQASSQVCLSGVTNFHWRDHMVQNMRAYFILYVITTKCIKCIQEMTEFSFTKTKVDLNQNCRRSLLGNKDKATRQQ